MTIRDARRNPALPRSRGRWSATLAATVGILLPALLAAPAVASPAAPNGHPAAWLTVTQANADVDALDAQVRATDPNPFLDHSEREWKAGLALLRLRLPHLNRTEAQIAFLRQVALLDIHSGVFTEELGFHSYGIWTKEFSDGEYVLNAIDKSLVGARLLAVNSTPIDVVNRMLVPYLNADNQSGILTNRPWVMLKSEMLLHLGVVRDAAHPRFLFRLADGRLRRVDMPPLTTDDWNVMWNTPVTATMPDTYTRQFEGNYATVVGHDVVYAFNSVDADNTEAIATMNAALTSGTADRVIFDMQYCGGGGFSTAQEALDALLTPLVDRPRRLLVITGRDNQSAASVVAEVLEHGSGALFVGEEPPTKPNPMTDETTFTLPNSQIVVHVPTYQHVFDAHDSRAGLTPDYPVAPLARAFFAGRDNLLAAAVAVTR